MPVTINGCDQMGSLADKAGIAVVESEPGAWPVIHRSIRTLVDRKSTVAQTVLMIIQRLPHVARKHRRQMLEMGCHDL